MAQRDADLESLGKAPPAGKSHTVELICGFEENKPSGAFTLTINR